MRTRPALVGLPALLLLGLLTDGRGPFARPASQAQPGQSGQPAPSVEEQRAALLRLADEVLARSDRLGELERQVQAQTAATAEAKRAADRAEQKVQLARVALRKYLDARFPPSARRCAVRLCCSN